MKKFGFYLAICRLYLGNLLPAHAVSVHAPSIVKNGNTFYVFGSHLAAARSTDLGNWTRFAEGVNSRNPLFNDVPRELAAISNDENSIIKRFASSATLAGDASIKLAQ